MAKRVPHYQVGECPILLILGKDEYTSKITDLLRELLESHALREPLHKSATRVVFE
jgi:hypothetical protein